MRVLTLDAIVTNYRTPADLERCLASFESFPPQGHELRLWVVNVDPRPSDEAHGRAATNRLKLDAEYLTVAFNCGYGRAVNLAGSLGQGEVVAAFNADVELRPNVLEDSVNALCQNDRWGVLGPKQLDSKGLVTHAGIFGSLDSPRIRGWHKLDGAEFGDVRDDAVSVSGSAYFIKRHVWTELSNCPVYRSLHPDAQGPFLPTPHYYEETWCSYHAQAHDYQIVYYGETTMIHEWHGASPKGGHADKQMSASRDTFRRACEAHGIPHD